MACNKNRCCSFWVTSLTDESWRRPNTRKTPVITDTPAPHHPIVSRPNGYQPNLKFGRRPVSYGAADGKISAQIGVRGGKNTRNAVAAGFATSSSAARDGPIDNVSGHVAADFYVHPSSGTPPLPVLPGDFTRRERPSERRKENQR